MRQGRRAGSGGCGWDDGGGGLVVSVVVCSLLFVGRAKKFCNFSRNWLIMSERITR